MIRNPKMIFIPVVRTPQDMRNAIRILRSPIKIVREGGTGSGNFSHQGRPGERGGSMPSGKTATLPIKPKVQDDSELAKAIMGLGPEHFEIGQDPKLLRKAYQVDTRLADKIQAGITTEGGITISIHGDVPTHGFVVGGAGHEEGIYDTPVDSQKIDNYINRNLGPLTLQDHYFGAWVDEGKVYLDVSTIRSDKTAALSEARDRNQIAIWSIDEGKGYTTMTDGQRPSESKGDPILESQRPSGLRLMLFDKSMSSQQIADAINRESRRQIKARGGRTITIRKPETERG